MSGVLRGELGCMKAQAGGERGILDISTDTKSPPLGEVRLQQQQLDGRTHSWGAERETGRLRGVTERHRIIERGDCERERVI